MNTKIYRGSPSMDPPLFYQVNAGGKNSDSKLLWARRRIAGGGDAEVEDTVEPELRLPRQGLLTAVSRDCFRVLNYQEMLFNDFGDRVAQLLHVESVVPFWQSRNCNLPQEIIIVNTHLLFPHDHSICIARLHQGPHVYVNLDEINFELYAELPWKIVVLLAHNSLLDLHVMRRPSFRVLILVRSAPFPTYKVVGTSPSPKSSMSQASPRVLFLCLE
ncbi:hypothetical protein KSP40_PGU014301 [Platanthera guangdongensis]|uniref:Uncharacterized protein n=1 Tax=Platanthera guangdongensis TaxID=2320717 RepID=A0ABR2LMJ3_9ASPA